MQDINRPDFDRQQLERNIKPSPAQENQHRKRQWTDNDRRRDEDAAAPGGVTDSARRRQDTFKHPAEFLKPDNRRRQTSNQSGTGGGGRDRRDGNGDRRNRDGGCGGHGWRGRGGARVPDYKKNPGKWTKYSLEDVDTMTNRQNTSAALQFLKTLK